MKPSVSSLYQSVELAQEPRPLLIGERCNSNGSRRFRDLLLAEDFDGCVKIALEQQNAGAHVLDICTAYAGRDEKADLTKLVTMLAGTVKLPLVIDSTTPDCIEACLKIYPGRCIINSINLEDGGAYMDRICPLLKKYGAAAIALTINKDGMAMTAAEKLTTAQAIYHRAVDRHGMRPQDLIFDPLTFTIGSGDATLRDAAIQTIDGIRDIKRELPGVYTVLGLSNISFGLLPQSRKILNSVFLHDAVEAGLDAAIVDASKILPLAMISEEDRTIAADLLYDRVEDGAAENDTPLMRFIEHFKDRSVEEEESDEDADRPTEEALHHKILKGDKDGIEDLLAILLERYLATAIINTLLVPAMRHVGDLFGRGELLLPFVLQSAEVMKRSVTYLEPFMDKTEDAHGLKILLATVQGDVHDIGKNLVDIILSNNGYKVYNIGIKVPAETIIAKAREYDVDIIGLSGLLVKSAIVMQETLPQYQEAGLTAPILLGGAALTPKFVAQSCVPGYAQPVVYCPDAFAGLKAVQQFEEGKLSATTWEFEDKPRAAQTNMTATEIDRTNPVPDAPFIGVKYVKDIDPGLIYPYINEQALFRGRWGYRRAKMAADDYATLMRDKVLPLYEELKRKGISEQLLQPKVAYGYFRCHSEGNTLMVDHDGKSYPFDFPRRGTAPHLCIADFYKSEAEGGDVVGFFVVTIGDQASKATQALFEADEYHDYLMLHAFCVEVTDALAEYWHEVMRQEMGIATDKPADITGYVVQDYQGSRYGFGYPACPDLGAHEPLFEILKPDAIGVSLTENMEMLPEQTTSAIITHHPQAKYFAI